MFINCIANYILYLINKSINIQYIIIKHLLFLTNNKTLNKNYF